MTDPKSCVGDADSVALDKLALAALRKADRISFHHSDGKSVIRATKENKPSERDPFAPRETVITVPCEARITDYERGGFLGTDAYRDDLRGYAAFAWLSHAQSADCIWQTIASILKAGDELTLYWQRGGLSHQAMKDAGLHGDALHLRVRRGDKRLLFLIDTYCGHDSTVRMVRLSGHSLAPA
jgi:hypothetical protein